MVLKTNILLNDAFDCLFEIFLDIVHGNNDREIELLGRFTFQSLCIYHEQSPIEPAGQYRTEKKGTRAIELRKLEPCMPETTIF